MTKYKVKICYKLLERLYYLIASSHSILLLYILMVL